MFWNLFRKSKRAAKTSAKSRRSFRPRVTLLEDRQMLSGLPVVSGLSLHVGQADARTALTITGSNLTGATGVDFGSEAASYFTVLSDTAISAEAPPQAAGPVDVTVVNGEQVSNRLPDDVFMYQAGNSNSTASDSGYSSSSYSDSGYSSSTYSDSGYSSSTYSNGGSSSSNYSDSGYSSSTYSDSGYSSSTSSNSGTSSSTYGSSGSSSSSSSDSGYSSSSSSDSGYSSSTYTDPNNSPPTVSNPGNQVNSEGDAVALSVVGTDPDGDRLWYSADNLPHGLTIDPNSGLISGSLDDRTAGKYNVEVGVSDGHYAAVLASFTWQVNDITPPAISSPGDQGNLGGDNVTLGVSATDADNDPLAFSASGLPAGLSIDGSSGTISGTINNEAYPTNAVTVSVTDGSNTASTTFTWKVQAILKPGMSWNDAYVSSDPLVSPPLPTMSVYNSGDGTVLVGGAEGSAWAQAYSGKDFGIQVTGLNGGAGNVTWSGDADFLDVWATGNVDPIGITGQLQVRSGGTIGALSADTIDAWAGGGDIAQATATTTIDYLGAKGNIGTVSAGGAINSIWAVGDLGEVTAGGDIGTIWAGGNTSAISAGGSIVGVQAGNNIGGAVTAVGTIGYGLVSSSATTNPKTSAWSFYGYPTAILAAGGITAANNINGDIQAGGDIKNVHAGANITASISTTGPSATIESVTADQALTGEILASGDIETISAGANLDATIQAEGGIGPVTAGATWLSSDSENETGGNLNGSITSTNGKIASVTVYGGDMAATLDARTDIGDILAADGSITGNVTAEMGSIGNVEAGVDITANLIAASDIGNVTADSGDVAGNITATAGSMGDVQAFCNISGNCTAGLNIGNVTAFIGEISGTLNATQGSLASAWAGADITGNLLAYQDIGIVGAEGKLLGDVSAGGDVNVWAGAGIAANITAGYDATVVAGSVDWNDGSPISGSVTAGNDVGIVAGSVSAAINAGNDVIVLAQQGFNPLTANGIMPSASPGFSLSSVVAASDQTLANSPTSSTDPSSAQKSQSLGFIGIVTPPGDPGMWLGLGKVALSSGWNYFFGPAPQPAPQVGAGFGIDWSTATKNADQTGANNIWGQGSNVPGELWTVKTTKGTPIQVWKGTGKDIPYFCHGLTFGGNEAPNGPFSPFSGEPVLTILKDAWQPITDPKDVTSGNILILKNAAGIPIHSATFTSVVFKDGEIDPSKTMLHTKNGQNPVATMSLADVLSEYKGVTQVIEVYKLK